MMWRAVQVAAVAAIVAVPAVHPTGVAAAVPAGATKFVPFGPARLLDSREPGQRALLGVPGDGALVPVQVTGQIGLPSSGIRAVAINVTVVDTTGPGYVQVLPTGHAPGGSSNLNVDRAGQVVASMAVVPLGDGGRISVYLQRRANVVIDVLGYFTPATSATGGRYVALAPARFLDSRTGLGIGAAQRLEFGSVRRMAVAGQGGVPADASAVVVNLTVTDPAGPGFVSAVPSGATLPPRTSTVNVEHAGQTRANLTIVPLGPDGAITISAHVQANVVADVAGYLTAASAPRRTDGLFVPVAPARILDTRSGLGSSGPKPVAGTVVTLQASGRGGLPSTGVAAIATSVTATEAIGPGFVTTWPAGYGRPLTSTLNTNAGGATVPNAAFVTLGASSSFSLYASTGTHLLTDVTGYFLGDAATPPPGSPPSAPGPAPGPADADAWAYWGYLYGDGQRRSSGSWLWTQAPVYLAPSAARFERGAAANGLDVTRLNNGNYETQAGHPALPDLRGRPSWQIAAFLAGIVEGEGDACTGLIDDDPDRAHVQYLADLLTELGVGYRLEGNRSGTYWQLYAKQASWPIVQGWPYATTARTPGVGSLIC